MTRLLTRIFIKDRDRVQDVRVRRAYGTLASVVGIVVNLLLFVGKFLAGSVVGSLSIRADAINNLTDAGSQIISLISFRLAAKPADRDHPFGHARMEYVASMIVSMLVVLIGYQLFRDSIDKLLHPVLTEFRWIAVAVLAVSVVTKLWLGLFNRRIGKTIDSDVLRATMTDSLSDAAATTAVLIATLIRYFTDVDLDAYLSIGVSLIIVWAGIRILIETKNSILGKAPDAATIETIRRTVLSYPEALGIHDLVVHNYGPGATIASLHMEVDGAQNVYETHDVIDRIEKQLLSEANIQATIHMDPIVTDDPELDRVREQVVEALHTLDGRLTIHDFRMVKGTTHSNLVFDVSVPFEITLTDEQLKLEISELIRVLDDTYCCVLTVDRV